jgi:hypothetical protein
MSLEYLCPNCRWRGTAEPNDAWRCPQCGAVVGMTAISDEPAPQGLPTPLSLRPLCPPNMETATMSRTRRAARPLEHTAYHEAGHAVAAWVQHRRFTRVTIVPKAEVLGSCSLARLPTFHPDLDIDRRTEQWTEREILLSLAGIAAEAHLIGRRPRGWFDQNDVRQAFRLALYQAGGDVKGAAAYLDWCWYPARGLVAHPLNWAAIEALAAALLAHRTLGERRARQVIRAGRQAYVDQKLKDAPPITVLVKGTPVPWEWEETASASPTPEG